MTKSYVKIYGPPVAKALHALEKVAVETPEVSFYTSTMAFTPEIPLVEVRAEEYLRIYSIAEAVPKKRREKLISKSGATLGEYDFFFEWLIEPDLERVENLINKIDEALKPLGCRYTITTR